jgi:hypothetical protein
MPRSHRDETAGLGTQTPVLVLWARSLAERPWAPSVPSGWLGIPPAPERERTATNQFAASTKETHMLWTILVIVVIVLAVIGLLAVLRGRA